MLKKFGKVNKIYLILFGIVLGLAIIEILLRLSGAIYYKTRMLAEQNELEQRVRAFDFRDRRKDSDAGALRILCLGDSWTFGFGAPPGYSYPAQLQKILDNDRRRKYKVYNGGIPGLTAAKLINYLPFFLKKYEPDVLVILIGQNDKHNPDFPELTKLIMKKKIFLGQLTDYVESLRIYKIVHLAIKSLKDKNYSFKQQNPCRSENKNISLASNKYYQTGLRYFDRGNFLFAREVF